MRLVLASASPARLAILRAAGVEPLVEVSDVDEDALLAELGADAEPVDTVTALALAKARSVAARIAATERECVVIGADSMLFLEGELVGKPRDVDAARGRWDQMAGRSAELFTGHALVAVGGGELGREVIGHARTAVAFGVPTTGELEAYLATGEPLAVAGRVHARRARRLVRRGRRGRPVERGRPEPAADPAPARRDRHRHRRPLGVERV